MRTHIGPAGQCASVDGLVTGQNLESIGTLVEGLLSELGMHIHQVVGVDPVVLPKEPGEPTMVTSADSHRLAFAPPCMCVIGVVCRRATCSPTRTRTTPGA